MRAASVLPSSVKSKNAQPTISTQVTAVGIIGYLVAIAVAVTAFVAPTVAAAVVAIGIAVAVARRAAGRVSTTEPQDEAGSDHSTSSMAAD